MGQVTAIEWCDHTFNPSRGCTKVSPGCANCYAETLSRRNPKVLGEWGPSGKRVVAAESYWRQPVQWDREAKAAGVRRRVFCASLADVFEDWPGAIVDAGGRQLLANDWWPPLGMGAGGPLTLSHVRERLGRLIAATPALDWLLLTKRPESAGRMMADHMFGLREAGGRTAVPGNVWLGTSAEDQQRANDRLPHLLKIPASMRFLSLEPLLGPVTVGLLGVLPGDEFPGYQPVHTRLDWVIVGGESGPGARPCHLDWVRALVEECRGVVPCFVKQLGGAPVIDGGRALRLKDKKGGDLTEWPKGLRVRQFPEGGVP